VAKFFITGDSNACGEWGHEDSPQYGHKVSTRGYVVTHTGTQHWLTEAGHFAIRQGFPGGSNHTAMNHLENGMFYATQHHGIKLEDDRAKMSCDVHGFGDSWKTIEDFDAIIFFWSGPCRDIPSMITDPSIFLLEQSKTGGITIDKWGHWNELLSFMMVSRMILFSSKKRIPLYLIGAQQKLPPWVYDFKNEYFIPLIRSVVELCHPDISIPRYTDFQVGARWKTDGVDSFKKDGRNHFSEEMMDLILDVTNNYWPKLASSHVSNDAHPDRWAHKKVTDLILESINF